MAKKQEKGIIRKLIHFVFVFLFIIAIIALVKEILARNNMPQSVIVDAGSPLTCNLLQNPKTIEYLTAWYGCQAPGAYLESVDDNDFTARYFTTNSQLTQVTYGPTEVKVLSIK